MIMDLFKLNRVINYSLAIKLEKAHKKFLSLLSEKRIYKSFL